MLTWLVSDIGIWVVLYAATIAFLAGFVKGIVGFAMPMIFVTGLTFVIAPDLALAILILPTLVTNGWQALRQGLHAAITSTRRHWRFLALGYAILISTTQVVPYIPIPLFFLILGCLVILFAGVLLIGWQPAPRQAGPLRTGLSILAGFSGGVAGIWGPPTVAYLNTQNLDRPDYMRAQGVIYGFGALLLVIGHTASGVLTPSRMGLSAMILPAALLGIWVGFQVQDRINQRLFRVATLAVLVISGANMIRRGIMG